MLGTKTIRALLATASILGALSLAFAQQAQQSERRATSYAPVDIKESFASIMARMKAAKPDVMKKHADLLSARYDLGNRPANDAAMSRGKPLQEGVRVKPPSGVTWDQLASMSPTEIRDKKLFPKGYHAAAASEPH